MAIAPQSRATSVRRFRRSQQPHASRPAASAGKPCERRDQALTIRVPQADEDRQDRDLCQHGAAEAGIDQRRERPHLDDRLDGSTDDNRDDASQRQRREPPQRFEQQRRAITKLELRRGAWDGRDESDEASEPDADRSDMDDGSDRQKPCWILRGSVAREGRREHQVRGRDRGEVANGTAALGDEQNGSEDSPGAGADRHHRAKLRRDDVADQPGVERAPKRRAGRGRNLKRQREHAGGKARDDRRS